jgi:hypothetical protein
MGILDNLTNKAKVGRRDDVDYIIYHLTKHSSIALTRFVDFALSLVENPDGIRRIEYYLFNGTQRQRNYSCLYFNRKNEWKVVKKAYEEGLIDKIQAFSR